MHLSFLIKAERLTSITGGFSMRKNRFCTFTLISALMLAALPASLAAAGSEGGTASASSSSLPASRNMTLTIRPSANGSYHPDGSAYTAYRVMSFTYESDPDSSSYGNWTWDLVNGFTYPGEGSFSPDAFGSYPAAKLQSLANQLALQVDDSTMTDKLPQKALNKSVINPLFGKILSKIGSKASAQSFADLFASAVPVLGAAFSGGLTYVTFMPRCYKLRNTLRKYRLCDPDFYKKES